jgi:hypothetical protein
MYEYTFKSGEYYNAYSHQRINVKALFRHYKLTKKIKMIKKEKINNNINNSTNSSISQSRGTSCTKNDRFNDKDNHRYYSDSPSQITSMESPIKTRNLSKSTISLEESPISHKTSSETKKCKENNDNALLDGKEVTLKVKIKKKESRKKKINSLLKNNENNESNNNNNELNINGKNNNFIEEDSQIQTNNNSPIPNRDTDQKTFKDLIIKGKQGRNNDIDGMENIYGTPVKRKKKDSQNNNNNNGGGKGNDLEVSKSSKYIELSSSYINSNEEAMNNDENIYISDSVDDEKDNKVIDSGAIIKKENDNEQ